MNKRDFPKIHFYDQDFVDIYDKTWNWISDFWTDPKSGENSIDGYFFNTGNDQFILDQFESIFSSFYALLICPLYGPCICPLFGRPVEGLYRAIFWP